MAATVPVVGHQLRLAVAEESTWGTAVTRDRSIRPISANLERMVGKDPREYLLHSAGSRNHFGHVRTEDNAGGTVSSELRYEGDGMLLYYGFGAVTTTGPSGGLYTHTYKLSLAPPTGMTMEQIVYEQQTPGYLSEVFEGCLVAKTTINLKVKKNVTMDLDIIAETSGGMQGTVTSTSTAPFTTNDVPMLFNQAGTFTYNSVALNVTSATIVIDHALERRTNLGALTTAKPVGGRQSVTMSVDLEWDASTMDTALTVDTEAAVSIVLTGTGSRTATFAATKAYVVSCSRPINSAGLIKQSASLVFETDGSNEGLTLAIVNTLSSGKGV